MSSSSQKSLILQILEQSHQPTMLELLKDYTPFQLLIATLLSARSKDTTVIPIAQQLFQKYPEPKDFINIPQNELEHQIYKIGFYRNKAKNIKALSKILTEKYNSQVPNTLENLTALPGVGRKTANCLLAYVFKQPAIAVDIHVQRISNRLSWINTKTPEQTELKLQTLIPKQHWIDINRLFVSHGQTICKPVNPICNNCSILNYCAYGNKERNI